MSFALHTIFDVYPCCSLYQYFQTSYGCIVFHPIDTLPYAYLFANWWTFGCVLISLGKITWTGIVESYGKLIQPELLKWSLSICKMKLNSGTRTVSTLYPGGTGRHLVCLHTHCLPIHVTLGKVILLTFPARHLPFLEFPKTVEHTQLRLGQHGCSVDLISSSQRQIRFWHTVTSMQTRGSTPMSGVGGWGLNRSWWVSPPWLSAIPQEESEWTTGGFCSLYVLLFEWAFPFQSHKRTPGDKASGAHIFHFAQPFTTGDGEGLCLFCC